MSSVKKTDLCLKRVYVMVLLFTCAISLSGCAGLGFKGADIFRDQNMDFGAIHTVAIMPFNNLTRDGATGERVKDVYSTALLASGAVYALPAGEVYRGITRTGITNPAAPSPEEVVKLGKFIKADAILTGTLREYGEVRSGSAVGYIISLSIQIMEAQTGRIVWSASSTKGGVSITDRLLGGGGEPMNPLTEKAVDDLINKLLL